MVCFELGEGGTVGVRHKVEAVAARGSITKDKIAFVVLKD